MGNERRNGVDGAIALIAALARRQGPASSAALARELGLPRASFHRICRTLAAAGIVTTTRGRVAPGPLARALVEVHAAAVIREDEASGAPAQRRGLQGGATQASGPIALSPPLPRRSGGRFRIGFSNASMDNPWRVALVHSIEYAAANLGARIAWLAIRHAGDDAAQQAADIEALIAAGVDGLIVSSVAPRLVAQTIAGAMARGVPVVLVDRGVPAEVPHQSFVSTDDHTIGRLTALWLCETIRGQGEILMLPGSADAEPAQLRLRAAREVVAGFPGVQILATEWTGWHRETGRAIAAEAIARWGSRIRGVWCDSGLQGVGSLQAFIAAGLRPGEIPPHTGGDLNLAYKLAIRHRVKLAAVDYPPAMGTSAVDVLHGVLRGDWVPRTVNVASEMILTRGHATRSVRPSLWAENHVRWDLPDDLVLASGLGPSYNPRSFRIHYPGNRYNRSAAQLLARSAT